MKNKIKKWTLRLIGFGVFLIGILILFVLNPNFLYANKTTFDNYTIYHSSHLDNNFQPKLDEATKLVKASELYKTELKFDICLNDGSKYPRLMQEILGQTFASGFYNKVVLHGTANYKENYVELNGYKWNLTQLLAHELTHCLQFENLGFWKSNPLGKIPTWKNEGYPEYIARRNEDQTKLCVNIARLIEIEKLNKNDWGISFADSTSTSREYYNYWILVQYCIDIKKMTYKQILEDTTNEVIIKQDMMNWYNKNHN